MTSQLLPIGDCRALPKRGISQESCEFWKYSYGEFGGGPCQIASYFDDHGGLVAQKIRMPGKEFSFIGDPKHAPLYGQWLWRDKGKRVIITEGEIDAISMSQMQDHKWPVVSVKNGASGAKKDLERAMNWLLGFEEIVLLFDGDEPGQKAAKECALLFPPGRCKIAKLPLKDANEMLQAGRVKETIDAIWGAKVFRPDGIVTVEDISGDLSKPVEPGLPWPWKGLTDLTYGRRRGEVYSIGAGTGVGKTDFLTEVISQTVKDLRLPVGAFFLESTPVELVRRIAGKQANKTFHIPNGTWTEAEFQAAVAELKTQAPLFLYDSWGATEWDVIKRQIEWVVRANDVRDIFIDHLTALAAAADDEKKFLEETMAEIAGMAKRLGITIYLVSHLATPEGSPHEEGGRVMIRHFKGSRAIGFWSSFMFGLERDQQAESEEERHTTDVRCLKDRLTGQSTGNVVKLKYDKTTGRMSEATPFDGAPASGSELF